MNAKPYVPELVQIDLRFLCYIIRSMPDACKAKWELLAYLYGAYC